MLYREFIQQSLYHPVSDVCLPCRHL
jgi:hypothetical protein